MPVNSAIAFSFRLYIAGEAMNSAYALANLQALCLARLGGLHAIEVVDVFREPERALADSVFMTPTLLKLAPGPPRRVVGTLSDTETLVQAFNLPAAGSTGS
jgi:circadian clock protein KaiB